MNQEYFKGQIVRLKERFGEKHFDNQFVLLLWNECHDMGEAWLKRTVDTFIGSRTHNRPPLLSEFREARLAEQKLKFQNDVRSASTHTRRLAPEEMIKNLNATLSKEFGAVGSVKDAFEIARLKIKTKGST